ncbi:MAG: hypothetical protein HY706_00780 [Candidatus Hydrogenedentes bacterium]|nr:hypothetical protein [Candidatus Hydrogenedentota bacterium]
MSNEVYGPVLNVNGTRFELDGKPVFLLGCSYYGALGIENDAALVEDLDDLAARGVNWIRIWATWNAFDHDISAVAPTGRVREPYMERLKTICRAAGKRRMVVDVTVSRGEAPTAPSDLPTHVAVIEALARELRPFRNVYFDVGNERNIGDHRHVPMAEVAELIRRVKAIDTERLCTASHGGDISSEDVRRYLIEAKVDFLTPHRGRSAESPGETAETTRNYLRTMQELRLSAPIHYQEPFRRGYGDWEPTAGDFRSDLEAARAAGAAGWCFHNGSTRPAAEERPRRSFDMRPVEGRLFSQLDAEEREFMAYLPKAVKNHQEK